MILAVNKSEVPLTGGLLMQNRFATPENKFPKVEAQSTPKTGLEALN
jgi:hypothetical protein